METPSETGRCDYLSILSHFKGGRVVLDTFRSSAITVFIMLLSFGAFAQDDSNISSDTDGLPEAMVNPHSKALGQRIARVASCAGLAA